MEPYAVLETGGKQYKVEKDTILDVELLDGQAGDEIEINEILAVSDGQNLTVGKPHVEGAKIKARLLEHRRGRKIVAFKKKRRKGYERKVGHRQEMTRIQIAEIAAE